MFLEVGNLDGLVVMLLLIMLGPAIILAIVGLAIIKKHKKTSKVLFILAVVYTIISLGVCGAIMSGY